MKEGGEGGWERGRGAGGRGGEGREGSEGGWGREGGRGDFYTYSNIIQWDHSI